MPLAIEGTRHFTIDDVTARLKEAREHLASVAADLRGRGVRVTTDARHGDPVTELVAAARETGADLIAMTTHGRSGLGRLLFGSVAEAVLRQAEIPVLMMRLTLAPGCAAGGRARALTDWWGLVIPSHAIRGGGLGSRGGLRSSWKKCWSCDSPDAKNER